MAAAHPLSNTPTRPGGSEEARKALARDFLRLALAEDLGDAPRTDLTSSATVAPSLVASAHVLLKQPAVVAGLEEFAEVCRLVDPDLQVVPLVAEGSRLEQVPCRIARVTGPARSLVMAERLALNLVQRLSAVATTTRAFVDLASPRGVAILDTRKTTPGLRLFEKRAVRLGGGLNHRTGLFDGILIKDNHVRLAGGVASAVGRCRDRWPGYPVEVEVTTMAELREALETGAEAVLLDNMTPAQVREAAAAVSGACFVEVSGGITLDSIREYLVEGVDAISVGALTHSAGHIDVSLEVEEYR